jgi:hypothetical protein
MRATITNSFRQACRQLVLFCFVMSVVAIAYLESSSGGSKQFDLIVFLTALTLGFITGPCVWLVYRFIRFLIGPRNSVKRLA